MKIELTVVEEIFVGKFVDSEVIHPKNAAYWPMVKKILGKLQAAHLNGVTPMTDKANELIESVLYKIGSVEADAFFEELLSNPSKALKPKRMVKKNTTKKMSQEQFLIEHAGTVDDVIYNAISVNPGMSRRELANETGIFLSTICGCIARLAALDLIRVSGVKTDSETNRKVELLEVV